MKITCDYKTETCNYCKLTIPDLKRSFKKYGKYYCDLNCFERNNEDYGSSMDKKGSMGFVAWVIIIAAAIFIVSIFIRLSGGT